MALKFIMGLNSSYEEFKCFYINSLKDWPLNLETAHAEAMRFSPNKEKRHAPGGQFERANAFAMHGRGGRGGRGYPGGHNGKSTPNGKWVRDGAGPDSPNKVTPVAVYTASKTAPPGYKRGPCNNCNKYGHYANDCREEAQLIEEQYWKEAGPRSPSGKFTECCCGCVFVKCWCFSGWKSKFIFICEDAITNTIAHCVGNSSTIRQ